MNVFFGSQAPTLPPEEGHSNSSSSWEGTTSWPSLRYREGQESLKGPGVGSSGLRLQCKGLSQESLALQPAMWGCGLPSSARLTPRPNERGARGLPSMCLKCWVRLGSRAEVCVSHCSLTSNPYLGLSPSFFFFFFLVVCLIFCVFIKLFPSTSLLSAVLGRDYRCLPP